MIIEQNQNNFTDSPSFARKGRQIKLSPPYRTKQEDAGDALSLQQFRCNMKVDLQGT